MKNGFLWNLLNKQQVKEHLTTLIQEQMEEHVMTVEEGKSFHDIMRAFHDWMFASIHPEPPEDAEANEKSNYSN